jgi:hypothetical protein
MSFGPSFNLTLKKAKTFFFDRERVLKDAGAKTVRALSRFGAFVRQRARSSMRKRKRPSAPGQPPSVHAGGIKRFLFFSWDPIARSVVIGPIKLNMLTMVGGGYQSGVAPGVLEFGGSVGITEVQESNGKWYRADLRATRRRAGKPHRVRRATYQARPFMGPALRAEIPNMPKAWATALRGS